MAAAYGPDDSVPADIRTEVPHPARVYDYLLGGCFLYAQTSEVSSHVRASRRRDGISWLKWKISTDIVVYANSCAP